MPDLPTVTVTGLPIFGNPFDQDAPPEFIGGGLSLNEAATASEAQYPGAPDESFAPPVVPPPTLLPEVLVEAPWLLRLITAVGGGLGMLLFPTATGPREFDEAPGGGGQPPPPYPPAGEDPIMPPNWWDLVSEPFPTTRPGPPLVPIPMTPNAPPVEMPPGMPEFVVSPPGVTYPSTPFYDPFRSLPSVEVPYDYPGSVVFPDITADPGPGSTPAPASPVRSNPVAPFPDLFPQPFTTGNPFPTPTGTPTPDVLGDPFADPLGDPIGDPVPAPREPTGTGGPTPGPTGTGTPNPFVTPGDPPTVVEPFADPLAEFGPAPQRPDSDTCQCEKKKPKKKRKPRDKCFKGTYVQRASGTIFRPTEEVPCDAPLPKKVSKRETDTFGRPVPKKRKSTRTKTWQDTLDEVFGRTLQP